MGEQRSRQQVGRQGEDLAAEELRRHGMEIVDRNWRCRHGEIDIVAREVVGGRTTLVFCEVKCRTGLGYGHPLEAITWAKLRKLRQLAAEWMTTHGVGAAAVRLDAIGVVLAPGRPPELSYVRAVGG